MCGLGLWLALRGRQAGAGGAGGGGLRTMLFRAVGLPSLVVGAGGARARLAVLLVFACGGLLVAAPFVFPMPRVFSPQYTISTLPFIAPLLPSRSGVVLATALTLNNLLSEGFIVTTVFWTTHWLLGVTPSIRALLLGWLAVEMLAALEIPAL